MFASAAFTLLVASSALASPMLSVEERSTACPWNSVTGVSTSFTLLAVNKADRSIQHPLVLAALKGTQSGTTVVASAKTVSKSYGTNFTMIKGALQSVPVAGSSVQLSSSVSSSNALLAFTSTGKASAAYCEEFNTSPNGVDFPYTLAVNGDSNNFALCTAQNAGSPVDVIIYEPVMGTTSPYNASTCIPASVQAIHDCC